MRVLLLLGWLACGWATAAELPAPKPGFFWDSVDQIAIQHRGRMKPFQTYANEVTQLITGKTSWQGFSSEEIVFAWLTSFDKDWGNTPFIKVNYTPLKKELGLDLSRDFYSPEELQKVDKLRSLVSEAAQKQQRQEKLSELEKKAMGVQNQLGVLEAIVRGDDLTILPNPQGLDQPWYPLSALIDPNASALPYPMEKAQALAQLLKPMLEGYMKGDPNQWNASVGPFISFLKNDLVVGAYPTEKSLQREIHFNELRPFRWAWVIYTLAFIALLVFQLGNVSVMQKVGLACYLFGLGLQTYGFALRALISGRPPVTNMYESVIWVAWGCVVFGLAIWAAYRNIIIPAAACVFAVVSLVLADNLPFVLDAGIHPLEPVLRSNFWLTIHVLTITLSYAAFALSLCLGNVVLGKYLFKPEATDAIQNLTLYMYRAVQIGVVLLAAGTILGGVWADYSWGRFWGWDPKEVWALIALLLYLAVLHGRFTGWIRGFGFVTCTVVSFLGVLMAWYGVNFVLGVGLHSYGFGSGGFTYVGAYIAAQLAFVVAAYVRYRAARTKTVLDTAIFPKKTP